MDTFLRSADLYTMEFAKDAANASGPPNASNSIFAIPKETQWVLLVGVSAFGSA